LFSPGPQTGEPVCLMESQIKFFRSGDRG
jgi:hypothetical protein